jgi:hypothetical protein
MQSIRTKFYGPGNVRGARIVAKTTSGTSAAVPYDHVLSPDENHVTAARKLARFLGDGWEGVWQGASLSDVERVFVQVEGDPQLLFRV